MAPYVYRGIEVSQQPSAPLFFMTAIPAKELLGWCDVPRAKGDYMAGYQRALNDQRSGALQEFFDLAASNVVPGAIIVALDQDYVTLEKEGHVTKITIREDTRSDKEKLLELFGAFSTRLSPEELASAGIEVTTDEWEDQDDPGGEFPTSYVASLAKELQQAITEWDALPRDRRAAIEEYIRGVSKPGLIIDGQHRAFGAAKAVAPIVLPVILMPGLAHAEQVFQFYVLNSKAKPLSPTELRRIVSTGLTNEEISNLYKRFKQAGINAEESRWTLDMNTQPSSPFLNRIDFGFGAAGATIKENVADQLVRAFMRMPKKYRQLTAPLGEQWAEVDSRLQIFFWFWNAVRREYADVWTKAEKAADGGSQHQLFMKISLLTLQKFLLDRFLTALPYRGPGAPPPLSAEEEVGKIVAATLENLPGEFFDRPWLATQIDTTPGRQHLYDAMEKVWNNKGKVHGNMWPFKDS